MNTQMEECMQCRKTWTLRAECIKLSGRSDVFIAKSIKHTHGGMVLVSRKAFKPGTKLDFPPSDSSDDYPRVRAMGLAEVRWIEEVMDDDGLAYEMGMRYVFTD